MPKLLGALFALLSLLSLSSLSSLFSVPAARSAARATFVATPGVHHPSQSTRQAPSATTFAARVAELSEPEGYFDTDNLISNERSYLHVIPALRAAQGGGGAYVGVGPDQNFSYIAQLRPSIAFIVDIRRDNLLLHLLFKALFAEAPTRAEYLSLLFGRPPPPRPEDWEAATIERLVSYIEGTGAQRGSSRDLSARLDVRLKGFGVPLSEGDLATIHRFHQVFVDAGVSLKFESRGRSPRSYYPNYGELLLETDRSGHHWNYLASEPDYQFVRSLEQRDLVIPVVGNLAGRSALAAIGRAISDRKTTLSAIYTSNVEFYLFGDGSFLQFVENLRRLPHTPKSLVIRSVFDGYARATSPGYYSASITQRVDDLLEGVGARAISSYSALVGR